MFRAVVQSKVFEIKPAEGAFEVNGSKKPWDLVEIADGYFHILMDGRGYRAEIVGVDRATKTFEIKVNGNLYAVVIKDKFDVLLEQMGMNATTSSRLNSIKAPMPGLIVELKVKDGDAVKAGDPLIILEAMKMENIIKSPGDGMVKNVRIRKGDSVEKNQVLIDF